MARKEYVKDAIMRALRSLVSFSYSDEGFLSRDLAPIVSKEVGKHISPQSVARHLMELEDEGRVSKEEINPWHQIHRWRPT